MASTANQEQIRYQDAGVDIAAADQAVARIKQLAQGATPLFFLDYFAVGKLNPEVAAQVVEGIARGCQANRCVLIGGETAEMPGMYAEGEYDLAGFIVGAVERKRLLTGAKIKAGDVLL